MIEFKSYDIFFIQKKSVEQMQVLLDKYDFDENNLITIESKDKD